MIVRWKGHIQAGQVSEQVWAQWDVLPTAAELAGMKPPEDINGISMVPTFFGQRQKQHEYLYWEIPFFTWRDEYRNGFKQAARIGYWKGVRTDQDRPIELYNLEIDEIEQWNVADDHPDIVAEMKHLFDEVYYLNLEGYR
jgi:arylsulfatase A-like enzyme